MPNFYFTFGSQHKDPADGTELKGWWVRVTAGNKEQAKRGFGLRFGERYWAFMYTERDFDPYMDIVSFGEYEHIKT